MMQVGDIVKHKNMPDRLRIRTLKDGVCTVERIDEPKTYYSGSDSLEHPRWITKAENLLPFQEEQKPQLDLFK